MFISTHITSTSIPKYITNWIFEFRSGSISVHALPG